MEEQRENEILSQPCEYKLEYYKYILGQIQNINSNTYKYLAFFQTLTTVIVGAGIAIFINWEKIGISPEIAQVSMQALLVLLWILTVFVMISIFSGILSWIDYRNEEVDLLEGVLEENFRKRPKVRNFWRWYETYILLLIIVATSGITFFVGSLVIPLIN